jgi:hypothetical protein
MRPYAADARQASAREQGGNIIAMGGDAYRSSLLAFHDFWRPVAARLRGHLFVSAPGTDIVLICDGGRGGAVKALKHAAQALAAKDERPLSNRILAWTPTGWTPDP